MIRPELLTPAHERYHEVLGSLAIRENFAYVTETNNASAAFRIELGHKPKDWTNLLTILQYKNLIYATRAEPSARYFCEIGLVVQSVLSSTELYVTPDIRDGIVNNPSFIERYSHLVKHVQN